jgi:large subunit ribosomal protein L17
MRHGKKFNHLSRKAPHRKATLSSLASELFLRKRIVTTLAKAKALRPYAEPLISKAKNDNTHSRRTVFRYLQRKEPLKELFGPIAEKVGERPGGYTRIVKMGNRLGDAAEIAMIELVDFNELLETSKPKKRRTRRGRRRGGGSGSASSGTTSEESTQDED